MLEGSQLVLSANLSLRHLRLLELARAHELALAVELCFQLPALHMQQDFSVCVRACVCVCACGRACL